MARDSGPDQNTPLMEGRSNQGEFVLFWMVRSRVSRLRTSVVKETTWGRGEVREVGGA